MNNSKGSWKLPTLLSGAFFVGSGLSIVIAPDQVVSILHAEPLGSSQARMYLRLAGIALAVIGGHQIDVVADNLVKFAKRTAYERLLVLPALTALWYFGILEAPYLVFGAVDLIAAVWTLITLRNEKVD